MLATSRNGGPSNRRVMAAGTFCPRSQRGSSRAAAYIADDENNIDALQGIRLVLRDKFASGDFAQFGPRFLHSTGQAYKGGPDSGVFLQITRDDIKDSRAPGQKATFGVIKAAQARGDFDVLTERGRCALRVHLKGGPQAGLMSLDAALSEALS